MTSIPVINIKAKANHHAVFLILLAVAMIFSLMVVSQYYWRTHHLVLVFCYLLSIVVLFTGVLKHSEPELSFEITPHYLRYNHRHGKWTLSWQQIHNINTIREVVGLATVELTYIGIRLKNIEELVEQISPRLANRLIHEQRPLLSFALKHQLLTLEDTQLNFDPFVLSSGNVIKGPIAAFLHHCQILQRAIGYHLYLPESSTDRELGDFCQLLKQCKRYSENYAG
ncbi:DUF2982 domain-containing protein [Colwellia sp. MSW7]|jgi:hypothetical protein|uniref:DUF2982 domain-containing protein n=1 Tax=Colwellia maritima TaxID=2912588 RepID=A0ABS9X5C8_9GAMM|nr:DUF2982 domain-containing protein [Colwellia maritima]MCI2285433.1 DUF2982 domain-containing protein [Colwellia maritima]